jgi:hypothetical protein
MEFEELPVEVRAVHEAGHAILADEAGILDPEPATVSIRVSLESDQDGGHRCFGGYCRFLPVPWPEDVTQDTFEPKWRSVVEGRLSSWYAGCLAEELFHGGFNADNSKTDFAAISPLVETLAYVVTDPDDLALAVEGTRTRARTVLIEKWSAVQALAEELYHHETVDGDVAKELIAHPQPTEEAGSRFRMWEWTDS